MPSNKEVAVSMRKILVEPYEEGFIAHLEGRPESGYGDSRNEAIGRLITSNKDTFELLGITVEEEESHATHTRAPKPRRR